MTRVRFALALPALLAASVALASDAAPRDCRLDEANRAWMTKAIATWNATSEKALELPPAPLPWMIFFDAGCTWHVNGSPQKFATMKGTRVDRPLKVGRAKLSVHREAHGETVALPDGSAVPAQLLAFAASWGENQPYLVMALPSIWKSEPRHRDGVQTDRLIRSVFVHEMSHTRQTRALGRQIDAIDGAHQLGESLNDDIVQDRFGDREGFRELYEKERDALFAVPHESDPEKRRALVRSALATRRERHERFLTGDDAFYRELETIFLDMEGVANWAGYRAAILDGLGSADALTLMRGSAKRWSQDEGLALYLALDAMTDGWQQKAFSDRVVPAWDLLAASVQ